MLVQKREVLRDAGDAFGRQCHADPCRYALALLGCRVGGGGRAGQCGSPVGWRIMISPGLGRASRSAANGAGGIAVWLAKALSPPDSPSTSFANVRIRYPSTELYPL